MRRHQWFVIAIGCALILSSFSPAFAATESYVVGAAGDSDGLCKEDPLNPTGQNIGAVCFAPASGSRKLTITDVSTAPVGGYYVAVDSAGDPIGGAVSFCGQSGSFSLPSGTKQLVVYIGGPALGPLACIEEGYPGIGTNGSVKYT